MSQLAWEGPRPPAALARELRDAGFDIVRPDSAAALPLVVYTASSRTPARRNRPGAWIWMTSGDANDRRRRQAVLTGAYAVVSLNEPNAGPTLIARLRELLVPDPEPSAPAQIVTESDASKRILSQIARVARPAPARRSRHGCFTPGRPASRSGSCRSIARRFRTN